MWMQFRDDKIDFFTADRATWGLCLGLKSKCFQEADEELIAGEMWYELSGVSIITALPSGICFETTAILPDSIS